MAKNCKIGYGCKNSCIEKSDNCTTTMGRSKPILNKMHSRVKAASGKRPSGGFNDAQSKAYDQIMSRTQTLFSSPQATQRFAKAASEYATTDSVKLTGSIRHGLEVDGQSYDKILDEARAESGLDRNGWMKVYNAAKNRINGDMTKKILATKGNC